MRMLLLVVALPLFAAERTVDPTFLHRYLPDVVRAALRYHHCHLPL